MLRGGANAVRPALQVLWRTRAQAYQDAIQVRACLDGWGGDGSVEQTCQKRPRVVPCCFGCLSVHRTSVRCARPRSTCAAPALTVPIADVVTSAFCAQEFIIGYKEGLQSVTKRAEVGSQASAEQPRQPQQKQDNG